MKPNDPRAIVEAELDELGPNARKKMRQSWSKSVGRKLTYKEALELEFTSSGHSTPSEDPPKP